MPVLLIYSPALSPLNHCVKPQTAGRELTVTLDVIPGVTSEDVSTALDCLHIMISKRRKQVITLTVMSSDSLGQHFIFSCLHLFLIQPP